MGRTKTDPTNRDVEEGRETQRQLYSHSRSGFAAPRALELAVSFKASASKAEEASHREGSQKGLG